MHSTTLILPALALLLDTVSAHGFVTGVSINSQWTAGSDPVWYYSPAGSAPVTAGWDSLNQDLGFVEPASFGTSNISCHKSATAGKAYANANAGDTVNFSWSTWPDSHKGPIINYIAPCDGDCSTLTSSSLRWSKISQAGFVTPSTNTWVTDVLIQSNFTSSATIPKNLAPGNYVVRHEIIALHGGQNDNGAQAYPQCLNLKIGGSGTVKPTSGVAATSLYTRTDPGILFNLYVGATSYPYPGPEIWTAAN
ncbi:lytic polysaccharide monooxygenase [Pleomassaria siparia CBS 279.74]|uniref:Lytic polysaccharide monooxygenase n=1 Tax=Pleomassaria siparia CBS 279.74 TaxID=1314801 RepID=A0A6G1JZ91_9PLEO|nr:lytic polysaccharide monooxygenase [Pleomassaria siparia CBS 279.74]